MSARTAQWTFAVVAALVACGSLPAAVGGADERPPSGWLGVFLGKGAGSAADGDAGQPVSGVEILGVVRDGPADRAGLRARDRIVTADGLPVNRADELIAAISRLRPDTWVSLGVRRGDDTLDLSARLSGRPTDSSKIELRTGWIGMTAIDLPESLREHFGAPAEAGVMVSEVVPGSPAEAAGIELGDVVYEISGKPVASAGELRNRVMTAGVGNRVEIRLVRDGAEITVEALVIATPDRRESS